MNDEFGEVSDSSFSLHPPDMPLVCKSDAAWRETSNREAFLSHLV